MRLTNKPQNSIELLVSFILVFLFVRSRYNRARALFPICLFLFVFPMITMLA